ncbi:RIP metalloprotease RseP [Rhodoligotrophos defluvii]|uniref:RIP metalloprotease RseP n=1 Tax=Rhodoligotrophos defluvii TaxID=2561934 RepID=UPI0010C935E1|nr:RIP metalloprotease RseP [Rhodoligotrophos defluvii]
MVLAEMIGSGLWTFLSYLVPFLFVLTIVVFFHELGHFLTARACGVKVDSFAVGFGRAIASWVDRHGTEWRIGWLPLGGYVSFRGDKSVASTPDEAVLEAAAHDPAEASQLFHNKPLAQRAAVVAAGPIANFIVAILIFAATFMIVGRHVAPPIADTVQPDTPAAAAGMQPGDEIKTVDGHAIETFADLQRIVSGSAGQPLTLGILRDGRLITLQVTPAAREIEDRFGGKHTIGILGITGGAGEGARVERYGPVMALWKGAEQTWFVITSTLSYVGQVIVGTQSADQLGGPLRIAQMSGEIAGIGLLPLINLAAVLSVSIGLINLFPIPILDGGHLLYYAIEAVRGRPLSPRAQDLGFRVGMVLVLMLMLFATWNDLIHFELF